MRVRTLLAGLFLLLELPILLPMIIAAVVAAVAQRLWELGKRLRSRPATEATERPATEATGRPAK
jgi:hypothetical protein